MNHADQVTKTPYHATGRFTALPALPLLQAASARVRPAVALASVVALLFLVFSCAPARAAVTHEYLPPPITEVPLSSGAELTGGLSEVNALTVSSGDLWVAERIPGVSSRIDEFDEDGGFVGPQIDQTHGLVDLASGVAVAGGTGEVFVGASELPNNGVVAVFAKGGGFLTAWTGADTESRGFGENNLKGVAVDSSGAPEDWANGDVYVGDGDHDLVDVFKPSPGSTTEAAFVTQIEGVPLEGGGVERFESVSAVAVNDHTGEVLVAEPFAVDIFRPKPKEPKVYEFVRRITGPPGVSGDEFPHQIHRIAVDGGSGLDSGDIYVALESGANQVTETAVVDEFDSSGAYVGVLSGTPAGVFGNVGGIAVDPASHDLYVGRGTPPSGDSHEGAVVKFGPDIVIPDVTAGGEGFEPSELTPGGAVLHGTVSPDEAGPATCQFEYGTSISYGTSVSCEGPGESTGSPVPNGPSPVPVRSRAVSGLSPDTTYFYRLGAGNEQNGKRYTNLGQCPLDCGQFTTPGPGLGGEWSTGATADSVVLAASVNPHLESTFAYFEYRRAGASGYESAPVLATEAPQDGVDVGSGKEPVQLSEPLAGLTPGTEYQYRLVVESEVEAGSGLFERFVQPGHTFTTQAGPGPSGLPDGRRWELVSPPDKHGAQVEPINEQGVVQAAQGGEAFTFVTDIPTEDEPAGYQYKIQNFARRGAGGGWSSQDIETPHQETQGIAVGQGLEYRAFSADLSQAIVEPLTQRFEALSGLEVAPLASERTAYLRADFACSSTPACFTPLLTTADVTSGAKIEGSNEAYEGEAEFVGASAGAGDVLLHSNVGLTSEAGDTGGLYEWQGGTVRHVSAASAGNVSADGSRVLWGASESGESRLYDWDRASGRSVRLDLPQGVPPAGTPDAILQGASTDGSLVFFSDSQALLPGADGTDLYVCEVSEAHGELACALRDLTVDANAGEAAGVFGTSPGVSEDGSYVYFMATGVLAPGAVAGAGNMYVVHRSGAGWGAPALVTVMAYAPGNTCQEEDGHDWTYKADCRTARVSPNGQWLAFMSDESLTGYDMHDASSGVSDQEVYLYSAAAGRLVCASCNPSGARPHGVQDGSVESGRLFTGAEAWGYGTWFAGSVPGWTPYAISRGAIYQSRYLSNSGRLFFDSSDALLPQDTNNAMDVYELEPPGVGSCHEGAAGWDAPAGGCLGLISSGVSGEESVFLDASESGSDVFFMTSQRLVPEDVDDSYDVYDAHECTPAAPCRVSQPAQPPPCRTESSCKPGPSTQPEAFAFPASAMFTGPGNLTPPRPLVVNAKTPEQLRIERLTIALKLCRKKHNRHNRSVCEAKARKTYAKRASAKRASKKGKR